MTEIEKKALALMNEVLAAKGYAQWQSISYDGSTFNTALCRAIEQHEAFKLEVSDAVENVRRVVKPLAWDQAIGPLISRFIIAKPDPLVEVIADYKRTKGTGEYATNKDMAAALRAALAARGLEVRKIGEGE